MFRSLRVRNYRLYVTGQVVKLIGSWMLFIAQDWLVLELSDNSGSALGLVTALQFIPVLFLTLWGGTLADRHDKRRLLIWSNAAFAGCALGLGVLVASGHVELWQVFAFAAASGTVQAIETPTRQAFYSELVEPDLISNALSLGSATFNTARIVGPAVAGIGLAWVGIGPVMLATAVMAVVPVVVGMMIRSAELHRGRGAADSSGIVDGLRYVWHRADLVQVLSIMLVAGLLAFNFQLTFALLAKTVFHTGASTFGLLTTALAVGALSGSLTAALRRGRPSVYAVLGSALGFGASQVLLTLSPVFWLSLVLAVPTGFFMVFFAQSCNQRVQLGVEAFVRGRVMSLYVLIFIGTTPIGAPLVGWVAERFGPRAAIGVGGVGTLLAALVVGAVQVRRARAKVLVHLRPSPHVHVTERPRDGAPEVEVRLPALHGAR